MEGIKDSDRATNAAGSDWVANLDWFDDFYLQTREEFLNWARKRSDLSQNDLIDTYQQAMVILIEKHTGETNLTLTSSLKTYLFGIAGNLLLKQHRKQSVVTRHVERLKEHWAFQGDSTDQLESQITLIMNAVKTLGATCRAIIEHFYLSNRSLEEIAREMGYASVDVAKTQKSRCIKQLREKVNA